MITISVCMIVKNEEDVLERCLQSIEEFADEIIVVDTGSVDQTKEIAEKYADVVCDFQWCADFAAARNFSFSKATKDYCMWLDADDVVPESEQKKIVALKGKLEETKADVVMMPYAVEFDEEGNLQFKTEALDADARFDEIARQAASICRRVEPDCTLHL